MLASLTTGPIPLRATYVIGNHERVIGNFPSLRETARASLPQVAGFAAAVDAPDYGVLARHGHEWDEHTHGWRFRRDVLLPKEHVDRFAPEAYEVMAIGEAVTAELMSGLVFHARHRGASARGGGDAGVASISRSDAPPLASWRQAAGERPTLPTLTRVERRE